MERKPLCHGYCGRIETSLSYSLRSVNCACVAWKEIRFWREGGGREEMGFRTEFEEDSVSYARAAVDPGSQWRC